MSECKIRIYDRNLNWIGETSRIESVQFERELYGVGKFQLVLNLKKQAAKHLISRDNIIVINNDPHKSGIIRDYEVTRSRTDNKLTVYGETGSGFLRQRIIVPPNAQQDPNALGYDRIKANAETVIKHYINRNITNPFEPKRKIPNIEIAADLKRGKETPAQFRYTKLDEDMKTVAGYAEMGFEIYADVKRKRWVMDVIDGVDRTTEQKTVSPVTFRLEYQNVGNYRYKEDYKNYRSTAYAGGQGSDENRLIQVIGADYTGQDRYEQWLDCGSVGLDDLLYYGNLKLADYKETKTVEVETLPRVFIFEEDYFLGDKVTIYISDLGLTLHTRITSVREIWERGTGYKAEARFGDKVPNVFTLLLKKDGVR